jgi:hypothetical protein
LDFLSHSNGLGSKVPDSPDSEGTRNKHTNAGHSLTEPAQSGLSLLNTSRVKLANDWDID